METHSGNNNHRAGAWHYAVAALAVVLVLGASVALRLYPTLASPSLKKMISLPVLSESDGYYYLRYAKEYCAGTYRAGEIDSLRWEHNRRERVSLPLLSAAACFAHRATGASIEHVALFMPMVFSAFVSIPIWLYRRRIGGELAAAVAIVFTLTSPAYVMRTKAGFFDTDCLIPFFFLMVLWLLHKSAETRRWKGVGYAVAAGLVFRLFMMWYLKAVLFYVFGTVLVVLMALYREENWAQGGWKTALLKLAGFGLAGYDLGLLIFNPALWGRQYISANVMQGDYYAGLPNIATSVRELVREPLWTRVTLVHEWWGVIGGAVGLAWLIASMRRDSFSILPLAAIGTFGIWSGNRYLIYLVPVVGIGLGFLIARGSAHLAGLLRKRNALPESAVTFACAVIAAFALVVFSPRKPHAYVPAFNNPTLQAFAFLRGQEPGLVWNWWDHGYAIQDIAGQATYVDGGKNEIAYYVSKSLVQTSARDAYDVIVKALPSSAQSGGEGSQAKGRAGYAEPVYILLTNDIIDKHIWITYYGKWDFEEGRGDKEQKLWYMGTTMNNQAQGTFTTQRGQVDLAAGTVYFQSQLVLLRGVHRASDLDPELQSYTAFPFGQDSRFVLELVKHVTHTDVFLIDRDFYETQFNRMLILGDIDPEYFELVYSNTMMTKVLRLK